MSARFWIFATMLLAASAGRAADAPPLLDDPTRPPEGIVGVDGSVVLQPSIGLTSVILPKNGRPSAIIDGQLIQVGGVVRNARLVRLTENSAVLQGDEGTERLYLTPDAEKKIKVSGAATRRKKE